MLPTNQAALLIGCTERDVFRLVESGQLHFVETRTGSLLICANSLLPADEPRKTLPTSFQPGDESHE
jgi:hypothetical protein